MTDNLNFWSGKNYMKRDAFTGTQAIAAPVTPAYTTQYMTQAVITHNLGITPFFNIFYEPFKDGVIWEALGTRNQGNVFNPNNTAQTGPYLLGFADTTTLTVELGYTTNGLTGTYTIYYVIYKDYGIA